MAVWAILRGFGPVFYILSGSRYQSYGAHVASKVNTHKPKSTRNRDGRNCHPKSLHITRTTVLRAHVRESALCRGTALPSLQSACCTAPGALCCMAAFPCVSQRQDPSRVAVGWTNIAIRAWRRHDVLHTPSNLLEGSADQYI